MVSTFFFYWRITEVALEHYNNGNKSPALFSGNIYPWSILKPLIFDWSMRILKGSDTFPCMHLYRKCHWSMTVFKCVIDQWQFLKLSLIDQWQFLKLSLIDQWQFWKVSRPVHVCTFTENVIDQWQFSKVSLINDSF